MKPFSQNRAGSDRLKLFHRCVRFKPTSMVLILLMIVMLISTFAGWLHDNLRIVTATAQDQSAFASEHERSQQPSQQTLQQPSQQPSQQPLQQPSQQPSQQTLQQPSQQPPHSQADALLSTRQTNQRQTDLVLMVSIPGFSFLELTSESMQWMPTLQEISEVGRLAALNVRTPERGIEDVYLTINAGAPAIAPLEATGYQRMDDRGAEDILEGEPGESAQPRDIDADVIRSLLDKQVTKQVTVFGQREAGQGKDPDQTSQILLDTYRRYTGNSVTGNQIVVPNIGYLMTLNNAQTYDSRIGRLGDQLHANGVRTAVFANRQATEDTATGSAPLMLMTSKGTVAAGNLSDELLTYDPNSPDNVRTDTTRLVKAIRDYIEEGREIGDITPSVILIEYGDWHRLDQERRYYDEERWQTARKRELVKLDRLLAELVAITDEASNGQLWIWSPQPHTQATKAKLHVTPFIQYEGTGVVELYRSNGIQILQREGLLTSPTTKRPGLISLHDLGPTLLTSLAIGEDSDWMGFPTTTATTTNALQQLLTDVGKMQHVYELRTIVVIPFVLFESVVLLLSLLFVLLKRRRALVWMRFPLFSLLVAPLVILLLGLVPQLEPQMQLTILLLTVTAASFIAICFATWKSIMVIAGITASVLLVDGLLGAPLVRYSVMGYDPMIGARYYGIGNEYMGVLVGCAILTCVLAVQQWMDVRDKRSIAKDGQIANDRRATDQMLSKVDLQQLDEGSERPSRRQAKRRSRLTRQMMAMVTLIWFLAITLYMAAPGGGTNAGGALTASVAFGITWLSLYGGARLRRVKIWRLVGAGCALLVVGFIVLWVMNQWLAPSADLGSKSHIGRAMDLLVSGRLDVIFGMIVRKLQMNLHLIGVSSWGKVLLTSIFVMAVLLLKPRGMLSEWQETRPHWMSGFKAIIIGAIVALALNDSGIVAAGTMIVFAAAPMLLFISEQMPARPVSSRLRSRVDR